MARVVTLYSGSSGNAVFVGNRDAGVVVDVGVSFKAVMRSLDESGLELDMIKAVLITHEHGDHIRGLSVFLKRHPVPVWGSPEVIDYLAVHNQVPAGTDLREISENTVEAAGMQITAFDTPHDSLHSLGYRLQTPDGRVITVATDLGRITDSILNRLYRSDLVVIESNYDPMMLRFGSYPIPLQRRIAGNRGHLSNEECAQALPALIGSGTTRIVLAHLSKENNRPGLAQEAALETLQKEGFRCGEDFLLEVAPRFNAGKVITL